MRSFVVTLMLALGAASPVAAQTSIVLNADPVPVVEAQINGRPVRLEVDLRAPEVLFLNVETAERLGVRRAPIGRMGVGIDGGAAQLRGRLARPRLEFGDRSSRTIAGIFAVPVSSRAEGVIGPAVLPFDVITITLGPEQPGARDIVLPLEDPDLWYTRGTVGAESLGLNFDLGARESVFNQTASLRLDDAGAIVSAGDLVERPVILGLSTRMQPVTTDLTVLGLALAPAFARTGAPLLGALEEDAIVVEAEGGRASPPSVSLGRDALSRCSSIRVDRRARQMSLRCAG